MSRVTGTGQAWERKLNAMHAHYLTLGVVVERVTPPWTVIRCNPDGSITIRFTGKGPPDYIAFVDGRVVRFDAKSVKGAAFPLANLSPEQAGALTRNERAGGVSGLVVQANGQGWWLPWIELQHRWRLWKEGRGAASVMPNEGGTPLDGADWLAAVRR